MSSASGSATPQTNSTPMNNSRPHVRVLHAVHGLQVGGIGAWLIQMLRGLDRDRFQVDVMVLGGTADDYGAQLRDFGCRVLVLPLWPVSTYARRFTQLLGQHGPYHVLHSHIGLHDGMLMRLAAQNRVPMRICHSRNTVYHSVSPPHLCEFPRRMAQRAYARLLRHWMRKYATHLIGVSEAAAAGLFGDAVVNDPRYMFLPSSIDLSDFAELGVSATVQSELGIPDDTHIVGHVGRFVEQKNHEFLIDIAAATVEQDTSVHFLLIGDGPLREAMMRYVEERDLQRHVHFAGLRSDVPQLMMEAMDVFVLPSRWEGLGRVLIEAQLAGLPCLMSDVVPREVDVVRPLLHRLSLTQKPEIWASELLRLVRAPRPVTQSEAFDTIAGTVFSMEVAVRQLERLYAGEA